MPGNALDRVAQHVAAARSRQQQDVDLTSASAATPVALTPALAAAEAAAARDADLAVRKYGDRHTVLERLRQRRGYSAIDLEMGSAVPRPPSVGCGGSTGSGAPPPPSPGDDPPPWCREEESTSDVREGEAAIHRPSSSRSATLITDASEALAHGAGNKPGSAGGAEYEIFSRHRRRGTIVPSARRLAASLGVADDELRSASANARQLEESDANSSLPRSAPGSEEIPLPPAGYGFPLPPAPTAPKPPSATSHVQEAMPSAPQSAAADSSTSAPAPPLRPTRPTAPLGTSSVIAAMRKVRADRLQRKQRVADVQAETDRLDSGREVAIASRLARQATAAQDAKPPGGGVHSAGSSPRGDSETTHTSTSEGDPEAQAEALLRKRLELRRSARGAATPETTSSLGHAAPSEAESCSNAANDSHNVAALQLLRVSATAVDAPKVLPSRAPLITWEKLLLEDGDDDEDANADDETSADSLFSHEDQPELPTISHCRAPKTPVKRKCRIKKLSRCSGSAGSIYSDSADHQMSRVSTASTCWPPRSSSTSPPRDDESLASCAAASGSQTPALTDGSCHDPSSPLPCTSPEHAQQDVPFRVRPPASPLLLQRRPPKHRLDAAQHKNDARHPDTLHPISPLSATEFDSVAADAEQASEEISALPVIGSSSASLTIDGAENAADHAECVNAVARKEDLGVSSSSGSTAQRNANSANTALSLLRQRQAARSAARSQPGGRARDSDVGLVQDGAARDVGTSQQAIATNQPEDVLVLPPPLFGAGRSGSLCSRTLPANGNGMQSTADSSFVTPDGGDCSKENCSVASCGLASSLQDYDFLRRADTDDNDNAPRAQAQDCRSCPYSFAPEPAEQPRSQLEPFGVLCPPVCGSLPHLRPDEQAGRSQHGWVEEEARSNDDESDGLELIRQRADMSDSVPSTAASSRPDTRRGSRRSKSACSKSTCSADDGEQDFADVDCPLWPQPSLPGLGSSTSQEFEFPPCDGSSALGIPVPDDFHFCFAEDGEDSWSDDSFSEVIPLLERELPDLPGHMLAPRDLYVIMEASTEDDDSVRTTESPQSARNSSVFKFWHPQMQDGTQACIPHGKAFVHEKASACVTQNTSTSPVTSMTPSEAPPPLLGAFLSKSPSVARLDEMYVTFEDDREVAAATRIQAAFRGYAARRHCRSARTRVAPAPVAGTLDTRQDAVAFFPEQESLVQDAAGQPRQRAVMQAAHHLAAIRAQQLKESERRAATRLQAAWRGRAARKVSGCVTCSGASVARLRITSSPALPPNSGRCSSGSCSRRTCPGPGGASGYCSSSVASAPENSMAARSVSSACHSARRSATSGCARPTSKARAASVATPPTGKRCHSAEVQLHTQDVVAPPARSSSSGSSRGRRVNPSTSNTLAGAPPSRRASSGASSRRHNIADLLWDQSVGLPRLSTPRGPCGDLGLTSAAQPPRPKRPGNLPIDSRRDAYSPTKRSAARANEEAQKQPTVPSCPTVAGCPEQGGRGCALFDIAAATGTSPRRPWG